MTDALQAFAFEWLSLWMVGPFWAAIGSGFGVMTPEGLCITSAGARYLERLGQ